MAENNEIVHFDFLFKTIVIGNGNVGKTSITVRYATDKFKEDYKATIGVEFTIKKIVVGNRVVKCQIWDTGGQERFSKIRPLYYRGAYGALIVFDVTVRESFLDIRRWFQDVQNYCGGIPVILVGNKVDLDNRFVSKNEGKTLARKLSAEYGHPIPYMESSAKTGKSISKLFQTLARMMVVNAEEKLKK